MADGDDTNDTKKGHTLADHLLGQNFVHDHDGDADHDHDHFDFDPDEPLEHNPIWVQDHVTLTSVGIDIGSARPQIILSPIKLRPHREGPTRPHFTLSRRTPY